MWSRVGASAPRWWTAQRRCIASTRVVRCDRGGKSLKDEALTGMASSSAASDITDYHAMASSLDDERGSDAGSAADRYQGDGDDEFAVSSRSARATVQRTDSIEKLRKLLKRRATAYISQREAMREFLVSDAELCELDFIERGNPYDESAPTVRHFSRQDVILKAIERWGSLRAMELEKERQLIAKRSRRLRKRASLVAKTGDKQKQQLMESDTVVNTALVGNLVLSVVKIGAFCFTGAGAMLSEGIHSICDFSNQYLLRVGARRSKQVPDARFPYGYSPDRYIFGLMSGVGIFFLGCGVTTYHGVSLLINPHALDPETLQIALGALAFSAVVESYTLHVAFSQVRAAAIASKMDFWQYVKEGSDPMGVAVMLEDAAAVLGVTIAALGIGATAVTGNVMYDAIATVTVGTIMGGVAMTLVLKNRELLLSRSIPADRVQELNELLLDDEMVSMVHDSKAVVIGHDIVRFKAEIAFNGWALSEKYIKNRTVDIDQVVERLNRARGSDMEQRKDLEVFLAHYGTELVEKLGDEVDRLEELIHDHMPEVQYIDLEIV